MAHGHGTHHHGHANDRGIRGALRYLRWLPEMWSSDVNAAVVTEIDPRPGERVVDIGAGLGAGAVLAARAGAHTIAVEPTPIMRRALAVRRVASRDRRNLEVVDGAAERIPLGDRTVDAAWAVNTMHHWVDPELAAAEIARVVRPGGRVLLVDELFTDPAHPEHERFGADHGPEDHGFTMIDAETMGGLLRRAGLVDVTAADGSVAGRPVVRVAATGGPATIV